MRRLGLGLVLRDEALLEDCSSSNLAAFHSYFGMPTVGSEGIKKVGMSCLLKNGGR